VIFGAKRALLAFGQDVTTTPSGRMMAEKRHRGPGLGLDEPAMIAATPTEHRSIGA
jgi:hypothetical protein